VRSKIPKFTARRVETDTKCEIFKIRCCENIKNVACNAGVSGLQIAVLLWTDLRYIFSLLVIKWDTRRRSWLRYCATSRKVAVWIPKGVIAIFHRDNTSGRTVALGSTQPLTEMSTRNISWR
jgi:hypothetical protein